MSSNNGKEVDVNEDDCDLEAMKALAIEKILENRRSTERAIHAMGGMSDDVALERLRATIAWEQSVHEAVAAEDGPMLCHLVLDCTCEGGLFVDSIVERDPRSRQ